jgi:hypothetical protein
MESKSIYPPAIQDWLDEAADGLEESGFFEAEGINPDHGKAAFCNQAGPAVLASWVDTGMINLTDEQLENILRTSIVEGAIIGLQDAGIIDSFDDETFFLTELGNGLAQHLNNEN